MIIVFVPALVMIIGLLMYALAANPKLQEIGRIMFFCGLLALTLQSDNVSKLIIGGSGR